MPEYEQVDLAPSGRRLPAGSHEDAWLTPDGWRLRRLTVPPLPGTPARGRLLFLPGRGDIFEKHLEFFEELQERGWHVTSFDWRGQGGSGRLGLDTTTGHIEDFSVWLDDLSAFWQDWFRPGEGPHVLVGHSMGGHLALRAVAERKVNPDAVILSAPMLGFFAPGLPVWLQHLYARTMAALGDRGARRGRAARSPAPPPRCACICSPMTSAATTTRCGGATGAPIWAPARQAGAGWSAPWPRAARSSRPVCWKAFMCRCC
jgi:lysophospholipase